MSTALGHLLYIGDVLARAALTLGLFVALVRFGFNRRGSLFHVIGVLGAVGLLQLLDQGTLGSLIGQFVTTLMSGSQSGTVPGFMSSAGH